MERFTTDIRRYGWRVDIYYDVTCDDLPVLKGVLENAGCGGLTLKKAERNIGACELNTGITYSNGDRRMSVVTIYNTTSPGQFLNTLSHEMAHVCQHIAAENGFDCSGEEICWLYGDAMQSVYSLVHNKTNTNDYGNIKAG